MPRVDAVKSRRVDVSQLGELPVVEDRVFDRDLPARLGFRPQQIALRSDRRFHRRDELLADRVERRIGDLREQLLEVVVEQARPFRQHRERRVGAHRPERLFARGGHRTEQEPQVLLRVPERRLALQHGLDGRVPAPRVRAADRRC